MSQWLGIKDRKYACVDSIHYTTFLQRSDPADVVKLVICDWPKEDKEGRLRFRTDVDSVQALFQRRDLEEFLGQEVKESQVFGLRFKPFYRTVGEVYSVPAADVFENDVLDVSEQALVKAIEAQQRVIDSRR
ncbi:MAG TPA: hypothetical protein VJ742_12765 [Nitrososphaera sp.]|nr:hypothetical protein [Nitrososphaera sp.]